jgi:hypothetical protein
VPEAEQSQELMMLVFYMLDQKEQVRCQALLATTRVALNQQSPMLTWSSAGFALENLQEGR